MRSRIGQRSRCRSIFLVVLIAVAAALPFTSAALGQQTNQTTLPEVTVIAPFVPLYLRPGNGPKAFERNPYFGNNRVEETRFAPVPCSGFRIDPASAGASDRTCLQGDRLVPASVHVSNGRGDTSITHCDIDHDVTIYNVGDLSVEADVLVFDPYKLTATGFADRDCYVAGYTGYDQEDFQDMNRITRSGADWHDLRGETCQWSELARRLRDEIDRIFLWAAQVHRHSPARPALARGLCLDADRKHLPHRLGKHATRRCRPRPRRRPNSAIRPGRQRRATAKIAGSPHAGPGHQLRAALRRTAFARTKSPSSTIAMPQSARAGAASRLSAPRGSPAASARAAAVIGGSMRIAPHLSLPPFDARSQSILRPPTRTSCRGRYERRKTPNGEQNDDDTHDRDA